jgi:hypothetical protein
MVFLACRGRDKRLGKPTDSTCTSSDGDVTNVTRTGLIAALVMGTALAACAERPVANGKNSNQAPQIGTVPMAPTANGAVRVSGGAVPSSATTSTLSPGSERPKAPVASPPMPVAPPAAVASAPVPVVPQTPPPPAVEAQPLVAPVAVTPAPVAAAPALPPPPEGGTIGQTLAAASLPPAETAAALPSPPPPPPPPVVAVAAAPVPVASGNVVALPVDGVTVLPPPPTTSLPAVVLPPAAASTPIAAQGISAPQPPLPPVLVAVSPTALPGKDFAEQLASFAAKGQPGAVAQINEPGQAAPTLLRLDREYFAASGRACREISGRTSAADVTYVVCQQESGWALVPALMRSRPLAVN